MNNYNFILENLEILVTEISIFNLTKMYPERGKVSIIENQRLINLKRQILNDYWENRHNLVYFTGSQWDEIKDYLEAAKQ